MNCVPKFWEPMLIRSKFNNFPIGNPHRIPKITLLDSQYNEDKTAMIRKFHIEKAFNCYKALVASCAWWPGSVKLTMHQLIEYGTYEKKLLSSHQLFQPTCQGRSCFQFMKQQGFL